MSQGKIMDLPAYLDSLLLDLSNARQNYRWLEQQHEDLIEKCSKLHNFEKALKESRVLGVELYKRNRILAAKNRALEEELKCRRRRAAKNWALEEELKCQRQ
jgi:hypothetical protein